jgi:hypothetical protein
MMRMLGPWSIPAVVLGWVLLPPRIAEAKTLYVANNGRDLYGNTFGVPIPCGQAPAPGSKKGGPCRSTIGTA